MQLLALSGDPVWIYVSIVVFAMGMLLDGVAPAKGSGTLTGFVGF
ncbi:hypothetical protein [Archangium violaceum]|nr:hypothetical protein [Archangium violaceum]